MEDIFINKVSDNEAAFVTKCYKYLLVLGVVKTKAEFSVNYLGKSKNYMAVMQTKNRKPSINCLHNLIKTMEDTAIQEDKQTQPPQPASTALLPKDGTSLPNEF